MFKYIIPIIVCLFSLNALGLQLNPSSYELAPSGSLSSHVFDVVNDSNKIIAVQISVVTREWTLDQKEINSSTANFDIFPSQVIIQPNTQKGVRIRWKGNKKLTDEKSYRLIVEQLPVSFKKDKKDSEMKVLHKVVGALYVTPPNAKASVEVRSFKKEIIFDKASGEKHPILNIEVKNSGTKHILLSNAGLVAKGDANVPLTHNLLSSLTTQNVLSGATLHIKLPWPGELGAEVKAVDIQ